jgi:hypothetical protein
MTDNNDLFNNPMIDSAKKAMTQEQIDEYKKIGKYMFSQNFNTTEVGSVEKKPEISDILQYAIEGLKSGLHPSELSKEELSALVEIYGDKWYENYGYFKEEVPVLPIQSSLLPPKLSRHERRALEKQIKKKNKRNNK